MSRQATRSLYRLLSVREGNPHEGRDPTCQLHLLNREGCRRRGWFEIPNDSVTFIDTAAHLFAKNAKRRTEKLKKVNMKLQEEAPGFSLLAAPAVMEPISLSIHTAFPDLPYFRNMASFAAPAISAIALFIFLAMHGRNSPNSMYKRYRRGEFPVKETVPDIRPPFSTAGSS